MNEIAISGSNFTLRPTGIEFHGDLTREEWTDLGQKLSAVGKSIGFIIGDWINYGETRWGVIKDLEKVTKLDYGTLRNFSHVSKRVQLSLRNDNLDWYHHAVVAKVKSPEDQRKWLAAAAEEEMSVRRLRRSVHEGRVVSTQEMREDPADRGTATYMTWLNKLAQWWKRRIDADPISDWDPQDRARLKRDLEPLARIYELL
jgi:hypothetical protein